MTYERLAYADQDPAPTMTSDCTSCAQRLPSSQGRIDDHAVAAPAPSLGFDSHPRDLRKPRVSVSDAAAHLAARLHLHLD